MKSTWQYAKRTLILSVWMLTWWSNVCAIGAADDSYSRGLQHLQNGELHLAIKSWKEHIKRFPTSATTPTLQAYLTLLVRETAKQDAAKAIKQERNLVTGPFDQHILAVMPFKDSGAQHPANKAMQSMIISDLAQIPTLKIVERLKLQALLAEMTLAASDLVAPDTAARVGRLLGAGVIIAGTVADDNRYTAHYQITTSVSQTESGKQIGYQEAIGARQDFFILQKEIVFEILTALGVSPIPASISKIHTKNWEAYEQFAKGLDFLDQGKFTEARIAFQAAITLDVGFDLARESLQATPLAQLSTADLASYARANKAKQAASQSFSSALTTGTPSLNMRYRYEWVDEDAFSKNAHASTLRTRLGYLSATYLDFQAFIEMEDTHAVLASDYNVPWNISHGPKHPSRPLVLDPEFTELNQFWLDYTLPLNTRIRMGRQLISLDDARFIGNVGWAQNEQTFDAITVQNKYLSNTRVFYGFVANNNTIYGSNQRMHSHLLNINREWLRNFAGFGHTWIKLAGYGYWLDFNHVNTTDTKTFGALLETKSQITPQSTLLLHLQYASQSSYADSNNIDADYYRLELGWQLRRFSATAGYEVMTNNNGRWAFQTPLAWGYHNENKYLDMPHTFNGWSHKFLLIPKDGLEDMFLAVTTKFQGIHLRGEYHDFSAAKHGTEYGVEMDLMAIKTINKRFMIGLKYADYRAEHFSSNTKKVLLFGEMSF